MHWNIIAIGKPKSAYGKAGLAEYLPRLSQWTSVECHFVKEAATLWRPREGVLRILLDEEGRSWTSVGLAQQITAWELRSQKSITLFIGGASGHGQGLQQEADLVWSLGQLTLPHEMALLVVLEQLYRAYTIKAGLPYHRG